MSTLYISQINVTHVRSLHDWEDSLSLCSWQVRRTRPPPCRLSLAHRVARGIRWWLMGEILPLGMLHLRCEGGECGPPQLDTLALPSLL
jgi:hypothetical protein